MKRIHKVLGGTFIGLTVVYFGAATWMVAGVDAAPFAAHPVDEASWQKAREADGVRFSQTVTHAARTFEARDGTELAARVYGTDTSTRVLYLHGVNSHAGLLNHSAGLLQAATGAQIITPDARGHGASGGAPFQVEHIGQYEEDLADILAALRRDGPGKIFLAGHSMGGGVALRSTLLEGRGPVDGYILLAPNFGDGPTAHDAPSGDGAAAARAVVHFDVGGFVGVLMYNIVGLTFANDTPVLFFNHPETPVAYTYAAVMSAQPTVPNDAPTALAALDAPALVLIGAQDQVFKASAYPAFVAEHAAREATVEIVPDHRHDTLINDAAVAARVAAWLAPPPKG